VVTAVRISYLCEIKDRMDRYVLHMNDNGIPIETPKIMVVNAWSLQGNRQVDEES
jgi:hypothetical protein